MEIQNEIDSLLQRCIACGKCSRICPSMEHDGCDPMEAMTGGETEILECISCGLCSQVCRRSDPFRVMQDLICLARELHVPQSFHETGSALEMRDCPSRTELEPKWTGDDAYVMPGCIVRSKYPFLEYAASVALNAIGVRCSEIPDTRCCTHPIPFRDMNSFERRDVRTSIGASAGGKDIVTLCAGCSSELQEVSVDNDHIITFLHAHKDSLPRFENGGPRVALQPGCSARMLKKELAEIVTVMGCTNIGNDSGCCGKNARVSEELMEERMDECRGADFIITACPMCFSKYDSHEDGIPVLHIAELVAMATGDDATLAYHRIKPRN
ncbi:MAG: (Fe-S)-binding protein [Candidatus Methanomethylophilaceae archaeon]|nr:(Fe-S)-binding protein [Candidatus Methanomethylophilaceae archaeon]